MSEKWQGLVQEKLFLAQCLLKQAAELSQPETANTGKTVTAAASVGLQAGLIQGAVALMLQAREALFVLTAQLNQSRRTDVVTLEQLAGELGAESADVARLNELGSDSWLRQLDGLQHWLRRPRELPKRSVDETLIAVAAGAEGPDVSPKALLKLVADIKQHLAELCQWHGEW